MARLSTWCRIMLRSSWMATVGGRVIAGWPRLAGRRDGTENTRRIIEACVEFGVGVLTLYAFSTENWQRPRAEVDGLFHILGQVIEREVPNLHENGVQLRHIGSLDGLPASLRERVERAVALTQGESAPSSSMWHSITVGARRSCERFAACWPTTCSPRR